MNTFGNALKLSTFGESHGTHIGCILDGFPSGIKINEALLKKELSRRQGGKNAFGTPRKEADLPQILSGVFEGVSTGAPIALLFENSNVKSKDYSEVANVFRPSHADFTYQCKYGIRDYRGGGRSSARESVARVAGGAFAKMLLGEFGIFTQSGIFSIGGCKGEKLDFDYALKSEIFSLDKNKENEQKNIILQARKEGDSIGGCALIKASGNARVLRGLGEPLYHKLDSVIGGAFLGLNGVKAVEIGSGAESSQKKGSQNNDEMRLESSKTLKSKKESSQKSNAKSSKENMFDNARFASNHSGGILGGIANGEDIIIKVHFKPTPSIFLPQKTLKMESKTLKPCTLELKGRHDPCIAIRGSVVCESMLAFILADMLLLNTRATLSNLQKIYLD
ncbi:chorismate synthase [Helicobacter sp. T3_23-1056]